MQQQTHISLLPTGLTHRCEWQLIGTTLQEKSVKRNDAFMGKFYPDI